MTEGKIGVSAINFELTHKEIARMLEIAKKNVSDSFTAFLNCDDGFIPKVEEKEEYVDFLNREISFLIFSLVFSSAFNLPTSSKN